MPKRYTNEFLISELQRFYRENGRTPKAIEMTPKNNYPSYRAYVRCFGSYNNGVEIANLPLNRTHETRTGVETCCKCGCFKKENQQWITKGLSKGEVMCNNCYKNTHSDYSNGKLNKDSSTGKATVSEQVVKNVLNLEERHDCNFACGFNYPIDLYHKDKYGYINVKDSALLYNKDRNFRWYFNLSQVVTPDTYVMLGYDEYRKNILRVWITDAIDDLVFNEKAETLKKSLSITNDFFSGLKKAKLWEVDPKPYNDMLHLMSQKRKDNNGDGCFLNNDDLGK